MTAAELLNGYSLEVTSRDLERLDAAHPGIAPGTAISIAFLSGDKAEQTAQAAVAIRRLGFIPVPHIPARRMESTEALARVLGSLRDAAQVDRVLVIAGDLSRPLGPYEDALAVIRSGLLARYGIRRVGITGYPEGHPKIHPEGLSRVMKEKLAALTSAGHEAEITTQFTFDADAVAKWAARIRAEGVDVPIRLGVAGPANVQSLLRFAGKCGVAVSINALRKYGASASRLLSTGTPDVMLRELGRLIESEALGPVKIHLYPFGGLAKVIEWLAGIEQSGRRMSRPPSGLDGALC